MSKKNLLHSANQEIFKEINKMIIDLVNRMKLGHSLKDKPLSDNVFALSLSVYKDLANQLGFRNGDVYGTIENVDVIAVVHDDIEFVGEIFINAWE